MPSSLYNENHIIADRPKTDEDKAVLLMRKFFDKPKNEMLRYQMWGIDSYPYETVVPKASTINPSSNTRNSLSDSESDNLDDEDLYEDSHEQQIVHEDDIYEDEIYTENHMKKAISEQKRAIFEEAKRNFNLKSAG